MSKNTGRLSPPAANASSTDPRRSCSELAKVSMQSPLVQQRRRKLWVTFVCKVAQLFGIEAIDEAEAVRKVSEKPRSTAHGRFGRRVLWVLLCLWAVRKGHKERLSVR